MTSSTVVVIDPSIRIKALKIAAALVVVDETDSSGNRRPLTMAEQIAWADEIIKWAVTGKFTEPSGEWGLVNTNNKSIRTGEGR